MDVNGWNIFQYVLQGGTLIGIVGVFKFTWAMNSKISTICANQSNNIERLKQVTEVHKNDCTKLHARCDKIEDRCDRTHRSG